MSNHSAITIYSTKMIKLNLKNNYQINKATKVNTAKKAGFDINHCNCVLSVLLATLSFFFCWLVSLSDPVFLGPKYFCVTAYSSTPVPSMVTMAPDPSPAASIRDFLETCGFLAMTVVVVQPVEWKHSHLMRPFFCIDNYITIRKMKNRKPNSLQKQQNICLEI